MNLHTKSDKLKNETFAAFIIIRFHRIGSVVFRVTHPLRGYPHAVIPLQIWIFFTSSSIVVLHANFASWIHGVGLVVVLVQTPVTSAFFWHGLPPNCEKQKYISLTRLIKKSITHIHILTYILRLSNKEFELPVSSVRSSGTVDASE